MRGRRALLPLIAVAALVAALVAARMVALAAGGDAGTPLPPSPLPPPDRGEPDPLADFKARPMYAPGVSAEQVEASARSAEDLRAR